MKIIVTGGAGFIGSAVCRFLIEKTPHHVINVDKLTYAANLNSLAPVSNDPRYAFVQADIINREAMDAAFARHQPHAVMHLAAESHVDRSLSGSDAFIQTNIVGTQTLLEAARGYWVSLDAPRRETFRFLHVSTDEVYGSLGAQGLFEETTPYDPSHPPTPPQKPLPTTLRAPGTAPTDCLLSSPTVPTTMARTTSPKSSFR